MTDHLYQPGDFDKQMDCSVEVLTRRELEAKKLRILRKFPELADFRRTCCGGCADTTLRNRYGHETALAFEELDDIRWLLGEDT